MSERTNEMESANAPHLPSLTRSNHQRPLRLFEWHPVFLKVGNRLSPSARVNVPSKLARSGSQRVARLVSNVRDLLTHPPSARPDAPRPRRAPP